MNRIRIAYILTPIEFGGAEKVNLTFLQSIDRKKYDIHLVLLIRPWEKENIFIKKIKEENYPIYQVPVALKSRDEGKDYFRVVRCFKIIYSFLKGGSFDVVHTHGYFADIIGIIAARILHIPTISTCHGFISNDLQLSLYNRLDRFVLRLSKKIIAVSHGIKSDLIKSGIKESRITMVQNAVNGSYTDESFARNRQARRQYCELTEKDFVVGYVGRLSQEKGVRYLIESISILNKSEIPSKLLIIGEGPHRKELEAHVEKAHVEDKVIFAGFQSDIETWLPAMDVFVLPSLTEGTPMSLLEAMAHGIPVIASAVGGIPQMIDSGENGILISPGKSDEIKESIRLLYKNKELRNSLSQEAQKTIRMKYDVKDWIRKIETEYWKVLN